MINDEDDPFRSAEAASLGAAAGMYRKAATIIWDVHEREVRPRGIAAWKSRAFLINAISNQIARAEMSGFADDGLSAELLWGIADHDGEAWWVVRVRDRKLGGPATASLRATWSGSPDLSTAGWRWQEGLQEVLTKTVRVIETRDRDGALRWFSQAFGELDAAGVIDVLLKRAGKRSFGPTSADG